MLAQCDEASRSAPPRSSTTSTARSPTSRCRRRRRRSSASARTPTRFAPPASRSRSTRGFTNARARAARSCSRRATSAARWRRRRSRATTCRRCRRCRAASALTWADPRWFTAATQVRFSGEQFDDDLNTDVRAGRYGVWDAQVSRADRARPERASWRSRTSSTRSTTPRARRSARRLAAHLPRRAAHRAALSVPRQEQGRMTRIVLLAALAARRCRSRSRPQGLQRINPPGLSTPTTYSHIVRAGKTLYIAGQVGADAPGKVAGPGMVEQLEQVLKNLQTALKSQGADFSHVAKITHLHHRRRCVPRAGRRGRAGQVLRRASAREHAGRRDAAGLARLQGRDRGDRPSCRSRPALADAGGADHDGNRRTAGARADGILDSSRARRQSGHQRR